VLGVSDEIDLKLDWTGLKTFKYVHILHLMGW